MQAFGGLFHSQFRGRFCLCLDAACFLLFVVVSQFGNGNSRPCRQRFPLESCWDKLRTIIRCISSCTRFQIMLTQDFLFALFIFSDSSILDASYQLEICYPSSFSSDLGLLFTSIRSSISYRRGRSLFPQLRAHLKSVVILQASPTISRCIAI